MISFKWTLSLEQPANETDLSELQKCLVTAGVFLDLSWNGDAPQLTISISEKLLVKTVDHLHEVEPSDIVDGDSIAQPEDDVVKQKGRPKSVPKNDITLARVHHVESVFKNRIIIGESCNGTTCRMPRSGIRHWWCWRICL